MTNKNRVITRVIGNLLLWFFLVTIVMYAAGVLETEFIMFMLRASVVVVIVTALLRDD